LATPLSRNLARARIRANLASLTKHPGKGSGRITAGLEVNADLISGASVCFSTSDGSVLPCCGWRVITQAA
jgi:hypothetical protein